MSASYHQKRAAISLALVGAVSGFYLLQLVRALNAGTAATLPDDFAWLILGTLVAFGAGEVALLGVLALGAGAVPEPTAHERAAAAWGQRNAYLPLVAGVLLACVSLPLGLSPVLLGSLLLLALAVSEATRLTSLLLYGRWQARHRATARPVARSATRPVAPPPIRERTEVERGAVTELAS